METHQFTSHSRAVQFLRMKGFTSWPSSPNYWLKKDSRATSTATSRNARRVWSG